MNIDRRRFMLVASAAAAGVALPRLSLAANPIGEPLHGLSAFGDLKYPKDFDQFAYATTDAPKGGTFNFQPGYWFFNQNTQTFNTLNTFVRRGDAPPRMEMCYDGLMATSWDEPDAVYCHVAETVTVSDDANRFTFKLRAIARWHDDTPITAADVKFSYESLKAKGHPDFSLPLAPLVEVIVDDEMTATLVFDGTQSAQDILNIATFPLVSSLWFAGRDFEDTGMQAPLGSGPYRVGDLAAGGYVTYERVTNYWADQIGTGRGLNHFDAIRIEFYRERQAAFEAFKKGEILWRGEFVSKSWATEYDFPAVNDGRVKKQLFDRELRPSMQAWALNQRRARFADRRVRDAIALCFDFEWTNENLFFGIYSQSQSLFGGSEYEAVGLPNDAQLALIDRLAENHVFPEGIKAEAYLQPKSDGTGRDRARLGKATQLLRQAGWTTGSGGLLVSEQGATLDVEMLINSSAFERIYGPFVEVMRMVGINASLRLVDPAQYQARMSEFDFDLAGFALSWGATPTSSSLETVLGSKASSIEGTRNWPGTADPLIDALIERIGAAKTRDEHQTAMIVLDRVLRLRRDWIPNWTSANHRVAYWDMFGFKAKKPDYFWPVESLWWYDEQKARAIGKA